LSFTPAAVTKTDIDALKIYIDNGNGLGPDPTMPETNGTLAKSARKKSIRFVLVSQGRLFCLTRDYFVQNELYNEVTGGLERKFRLIPESIITGPAKDVILKFVSYHSIPNNSMILVQIQTSTVTGHWGEKRRASVTGQGIHTDGHEVAEIVCLQRDGVEGAKNRFFGDLQGLKPLCDETVLAERDAAYFIDNMLYHYVSRAWKPDEAKHDGKRSVMILHYPADQALFGAANPHNTLGARSKDSVVASHKF